MKAYLLVTGSIFGLLVVAHILRLVQEPHIAGDPWWWVITLLAAGLCAWAFRVLALARRGGASG